MILTARDLLSTDSPAALEALCRRYWYPLYVYVRRRGYQEHDAQDMIQEFFARLLARNFLDTVHPDKGKFRSFLLGAMNHFLAKEWARANRQKRGGGQVVFSLDEVAEERYRREQGAELTPEKAYERRWAMELLDRAMMQLQREFAGTRKESLFKELKAHISGDKAGCTYSEVAVRLNMSEAAVKMAVHRLRQRYGELLRSEIGQTVESPAEIDEEIRFLFCAIESAG